MTQEVQPLAWQKRTNLEEHQQFFAKINEIIANLAPTVNEAEQAIAQATQAIASANAAIATANAASANADAASEQAQMAAGTVAGYDARMTAAESKNTQQDAAITALQTADGQNVKISGNQNITGIKTVPTEATGVRSQQIANSTKVGAELDNYEHMLRTTGNQTKAGTLTLSSPAGLDISNDSWRLNLTFPGATKENTTTAYSGWLRFMAGNPESSGEIGRFEYDMMDNGHRRIRLFLVSPSGQYVAKTLFEIDENGGVVG